MATKSPPNTADRLDALEADIARVRRAIAEITATTIVGTYSGARERANLRVRCPACADILDEFSPVALERRVVA
jgi:hypothetical protein